MQKTLQPKLVETAGQILTREWALANAMQLRDSTSLPNNSSADPRWVEVSASGLLLVHQLAFTHDG